MTQNTSSILKMTPSDDTPQAIFREKDVCQLEKDLSSIVSSSYSCATPTTEITNGFISGSSGSFDPEYDDEEQDNKGPPPCFNDHDDLYSSSKPSKTKEELEDATQRKERALTPATSCERMQDELGKIGMFASPQTNPGLFTRQETAETEGDEFESSVHSLIGMSIDTLAVAKLVTEKDEENGLSGDASPAQKAEAMDPSTKFQEHHPKSPHSGMFAACLAVVSLVAIVLGLLIVPTMQ